MPHVVLSEVAAAIEIQTGAIVSRVIFRDDRTEVTVFGFDRERVSANIRHPGQPSCRLSKAGSSSSRTVSNSTRDPASGYTWSQELLTVSPRRADRHAPDSHRRWVNRPNRSRPGAVLSRSAPKPRRSGGSVD